MSETPNLIHRAPPAPGPKVKVGKQKPPAVPSDTITVQDALGRMLMVKKLSLMEEMNLIATAGGERSSNARWMQYASIVSCVRNIDGEPTLPPQTLRILQNNIQLVGSEGFAAVVQALAADLPDGIETAGPMQGADAATAKN